MKSNKYIILLLLVLDISFIKNVYAEKLKDVDFKIFSDYANSVRACNPRILQIPDLFGLSMLEMAQKSGANVDGVVIQPVKVEILGLANGKCHVKFTNTMPDFNSPSKSEKIVNNCYFSQDDSKQVADYAEKIASGTFNLSTSDPTNQIMQKSCTQAPG